jgi:nicotinic acid phosphoribosyltransferase
MRRQEVSTAPCLQSKLKESAEIEDAVQAYLKAGNKIDEFGMGVSGLHKSGVTKAQAVQLKLASRRGKKKLKRGS